jgi:replicative DNA helicase
LVVVDYLQLMKPGPGRFETREREVTHISQELRSLAGMYEVPFIIVAQLNREPQNRKDKRPQKSDLRESGNLENDADSVWLLYNDPEDQSKTQYEVIIDKNRDGPRGVANLVFTPEFTRFTNQTVTPG